MVRETIPGEIVVIGEVKTNLGAMCLALQLPSPECEFRVVVGIRPVLGTMVAIVLDHDAFETLKQLIGRLDTEHLETGALPSGFPERTDA